MPEPDNVERQRGRWRRARRLLRLEDPASAEFSTGGLTRRVAEPSVRLLILPGDSEGWHIDFDDDFWAWFEQEHRDPSTGHPMRWGSETCPTADAAVRARRADEARWSQYLALHRSGAVEFELGEDGAYRRGEQRSFRLITIVGRVRAALALCGEVRERYEVDGPWELSLALVGTEGARLGNFGEGWLEPWDYDYSTRPCLEPNLFTRRELSEWPSADEQERLALGLGAWIEDAWGTRHRRFLAHRGEYAGKFDISKYQWRG